MNWTAADDVPDNAEFSFLWSDDEMSFFVSPPPRRRSVAILLKHWLLHLKWLL